MRIISGRLGGRQFDAPKGHKTHPMSEKMRGALFNVLGDISGLTVFDSYGGSGAMAFEAVSRGASAVKVCEIDKKAVKIIAQNVKLLNVSQGVELIKYSSAMWVEANPSERFDLVICDPPYNDIKESQLQTLSKAVKPHGLLILSLPPDYLKPEYDGYKIELQKNYGDSALIFYRRLA
jgi:16S rRNA (guanine966-N2)-methyltransferase